jgi:hypothetical protein
MPKDYLFVSCDIVAHSTEPSLDTQRKRLVSLNEIIEDKLISGDEIDFLPLVAIYTMAASAFATIAS